MLRRRLSHPAGPTVLLVDSITQIEAGDAGAVIVSGSHGGRSSGEVALRVPAAAVFFSDAGIGKDDAGIAALDMLQQRSVPAGAIDAHSARIGDAEDIWENGVISHLNDAAQVLGLRVSNQLRAEIARCLATNLARQ